MTASKGTTRRMADTFPNKDITTAKNAKIHYKEQMHLYNKHKNSTKSALNHGTIKCNL